MQSLKKSNRVYLVRASRFNFLEENKYVYYGGMQTDDANVDVKALGIIAVQSRNLPLISDYKDPIHRQKQGGGYYIAMRNTTPQKKEWLDEIADRLGVELRVIANPRTHS